MSDREISNAKRGITGAIHALETDLIESKKKIELDINGRTVVGTRQQLHNHLDNIIDGK